MRKDPEKKLRRAPEVELSDEGGRMLNEAEADIKGGRALEYEDVEDLIDDLHDAVARD
ncbi:MAG: hypothetical protein ACLFU7_05595 [Armatimonadota bacterium]